MESLDLIKNRIQGIVSTRQITRSMRLVSSSKVWRTRSRMEANRPFLEEARRLVRVAAENTPDRGHPSLGQQGENSRAAVVVVSGDRGLCGGYNINVCRHGAALIKSLGGGARIVTVGVKARDYFRRRYKGALAHSLIGISENPSYDDAKEIANLIQGWHDSGEVGQVYLVYTRFQSMLVQTPAEQRLLPLDLDELPAPGKQKMLARCEPDSGFFLSRTVSFFLAAGVFGAILESACCEQSARVTSMDSAVKNADERIEDLTLLYNQARQGAITQEIIEIVAGADAV